MNASKFIVFALLLYFWVRGWFFFKGLVIVNALVFTVWAYYIPLMKWMIWVYSYIQVKWFLRHYNTSDVTFLSLITYDEWPFAIVSYDTNHENEHVYLVALTNHADFEDIAREIHEDINDPDEEMSGPKMVEAMAYIRDDEKCIFTMNVTTIYYQFSGPFRDFRYGLVDENIYAQYLMREVIPPKYKGCTMILGYKNMLDEKRAFGDT